MILTIGYCAYRKVKLNLSVPRERLKTATNIATRWIRCGERHGQLTLPEHVRVELPIVEQIPFVEQTVAELHKNSHCKLDISKEKIRVF